MHERSYWLGFSLCPGIGSGKFAKLLAFFGTAEHAWNAQESALQEVIGEKATAVFLSFRGTFSFEQYKEALRKKAVSYVTLAEKEYPTLLSQIKNPPFVLFCKGNAKLLTSDACRIGIVGTRNITSYGKQVTEHITRELVDAGCIIVSGLALGVDAVSHQTTLDAKGKTIAVLGCGVDCPSPAENAQLYATILENLGLVVSEYGLGVAPTKWSFPARNRIIAGLSVGIVVTEGAANSGALITAKDATENGRPVFAVPGPVTSPLSKGPLDLIKQGATLVGSGREVLEALGIRHASGKGKQSVVTGDTKEEQLILDALQHEDLHIDELAKKVQREASKLGALLSVMEMKGMITSLGSGMLRLGE